MKHLSNRDESTSLEAVESRNGVGVSEQGGGFPFVFSFVGLIPLALLFSVLVDLKPNLPYSWTPSSFCEAGHSLPPLATPEIYELNYGGFFLGEDHIVVKLMPDGSGQLQLVRARYRDRKEVTEAPAPVSMPQDAVACIRGLIAEMEFWSDYDEPLLNGMCTDADHFELIGTRQGASRRRDGGCGHRDGYEPYVTVFRHVVDELGISEIGSGP